MKHLFRILVLAPFIVNPAIADDSGVKAAPLSAKDRVEIAKIQDYLNHMKTVSADFLQVDDRGGMMNGKLSIQRPGMMRVVYDAPSKDFIVADGRMVHIWNDDLKSQTNVEEGSSLADFILRDPIQLGGDVTITFFQHFPAKTELTLVESKDPAAGSLTLIFEENPLILRQWRVTDPQGHITGVNLQNMRTDVTFAETEFDFMPPNFGKGGKAQN